MYQEITAQNYSLGDVLANAWRVFSKNFPALLAITLIIHVPKNFVLATLPDPTANASNPALAFNYLRIAMLLELLVGIVGTMAVIFVAERAVRNKPASAVSALRKSFSKWFAMVGTTLLAGVITITLSLAFIIPGIIWMIYYAFSAQVIILRDKRFKTALDYSKSLVRGKWWKTFSILCALIILQFACYAAVSIAIAPALKLLNVPMAQKALAATLIDIIEPYFLIGITLLFLHLDYQKHNTDSIEPAT